MVAENGKQLVTCKTLNKSYSWSADFRFSTPASILKDLRVAKLSSLQYSINSLMKQAFRERGPDEAGTKLKISYADD